MGGGGVGVRGVGVIGLGGGGTIGQGGGAAEEGQAPPVVERRTREETFARESVHAARPTKAPQVPQIRAAAATVTGALPAAAIRAVIERQEPAIRHAYSLALQQNPSLAGRVVVRIAIGPDGSVTAATIEESTLGDPATEARILEVVRGLAFPAVPGGGVAVVRYPFVFAPSG
jgi:TonB family protein